MPFDETHNLWNEYRECWDVQVAQNRRYDFRPGKFRSKEDNGIFDKLTARVQEIHAIYDAENPVPPCELCGTRRTSFWDVRARCMNIARCANAPKVMGG